MNIRKVLLLLSALLIATGLTAQDYEIWGTLKISGSLNHPTLKEKWTLEMEVEDRYNFDVKNIRYFHYDIGALYTISNTEDNGKFQVGLFYRDIFETKDDIITRVTVPHGDFVYSNWGFKFRARLEYIVKYHDIENSFRLRLRPGIQTKFWKNCNPFFQDEVFLTNVDELDRNRLNVGITIKAGKFSIQPGYLLETNHKELDWTNKNILWINTKISF